LKTKSQVFLVQCTFPDVAEGTRGELNNDPTKGDYVITMGRPVNSLDRIYHLPGTAEVSDNMSVRFVNISGAVTSLGLIGS